MRKAVLIVCLLALAGCHKNKPPAFQPHSVELNWSKSPSPIDGYNIYRAIGTGPYELIANLGVTNRYLDYGVPCGVSLRYEVSAFRADDHAEAVSAPIEIQAIPCPPRI